MGFFKTLVSLPGEAVKGVRKTIDRITGVEQERQAAKRETKKIQKDLNEVKQLVAESKAKKAAQTSVQLHTLDAKLAGRGFVLKKGTRRLPYSYNGRLLELEADFSEMEKDIASDLKALKSAIEETNKQQIDALQKTIDDLQGRIDTMEKAAEKAAEAQEATVKQVADELGDLRTYTQTLDAEQGKRSQGIALLQGPILGIMTNLVSALNASDRPINPVGIWISEGIEAYTRLEAMAEAPDETRQWLNIGALVARAWAYYDPRRGLSSILGPDQIKSLEMNRGGQGGGGSVTLDPSTEQRLKDLEELNRQILERLEALN